MENYQGVNYFDVGSKFAELLREQLTAQEWREMCQRNAAEHDDGICHSHDFCDANMVMAEAMEEYGLPEISDDDDLVEFCNTAWDYAKIKYLCGE
jgi:hypothetical protein